MNSKKKKYYDGKIPFGIGKNYLGDGKWEEFREQQSWEHSWQDGAELQPNRQFTAQLEFLSMSRGRSAANFEAILRNVSGWYIEFREYMEGCHVNIFMVDMLEILQKTDISKGITAPHIWTFCKRGSNYGIQLVDG